MAEKESAYEPAANKPNVFKPPSLSSPNGSNGKSGDQQNNSFGGYYQNVTQKSKLILPTVIWILIVVAGLCFLSLLSSLNKTLNTLETLVEIEQSNAQLNEQHNRLHIMPSKSFELTSSNDPTSGDAFKAKPSSPIASWLSLPSWTSLEPKQSFKSPLEEQPSEEPRKIYKLLSDHLASPEELPIGSNSKARQLDGDVIDLGANPDENPIDSIMSSILESVLEQDLANGEGANGQVNRIGGHESSMPMISANIDKVNININTRSEDDNNSGERRKPKSSRRWRKNHSERKQQVGDNPSDGSIENLIEQIVGGSSDGGESIQFLSLDDKSAPQLWAGSLDESVALKNDDFPWSYHQRLPSRLHRPPIEHEHHSHSHPQPHQVQELPLLMPPLDLAPEPFKPDNFIPSSMFGRPSKLQMQQPQIIIELDDQDIVNSSGEGGSKRKKAKPQVGASPYEFMFKEMIGDDMPTKAKQGETISDADLINSLAQSLLQAQESQQVSGNKLAAAKQQPAEETNDDHIVIINGEPQSNDKRKPASPFADKEPFPIGDLFGLLFGQAPGSKSAVAPQRVLQIDSKQVDNQQQHSTEADRETSATSEAGKTVSPVITLLSNRPSQNESEGALDQTIVNEMLGDMLAMAQLEGNTREPMNVEAQSKDASTESMICECHKANSTSSSAKAPSVGSSQSASNSSRQSSTTARPSSGGSGSSSGGSSSPPPMPIGLIPIRAGPGAAPSAFAMANQPRTSSQQWGNSPDRDLSGPPSARDSFARPDSLLSALNNSTGGFIPRFLNHLNSTSFPCDGTNSTTKTQQQQQQRNPPQYPTNSNTQSQQQTTGEQSRSQGQNTSSNRSMTMPSSPMQSTTTRSSVTSDQSNARDDLGSRQSSSPSSQQSSQGSQSNYGSTHSTNSNSAAPNHSDSQSQVQG